MERLTIPDVKIDEKTTKRAFVDGDTVRACAMEFYWRLKKIEDILGADYDLDRLRELVEADREGRCVVLPEGDYSDKDGESALKTAMRVVSFHNDPVTRYIADAVAEKLASQAAEAALKGEAYGG